MIIDTRAPRLFTPMITDDAMLHIQMKMLSPGRMLNDADKTPTYEMIDDLLFENTPPLILPPRVFRPRCRRRRWRHD